MKKHKKTLTERRKSFENPGWKPEIRDPTAAYGAEPLSAMRAEKRKGVREWVSGAELDCRHHLDVRGGTVHVFDLATALINNDAAAAV